jgi:predicted MFS family arabinose efflux permease
LEREHAHRYALLEYGYVVCIVALLIGVATVREKKTRRSLLILTILAFALLVLLSPAAQYVKTK